MLFAVQKVLYWFWVIHFYDYDVKSSEPLQLNRSSPQWFCKYIYNTAILNRQHSTDAVVQLIVNIDFISAYTYG